MTTVARLYRFRASHYLPGVKGYDQPHDHEYTVEVAVTGPLCGGMVVDTGLLDNMMAPWLKRWENALLNEIVRGPTTVESLARFIRDYFDDQIAGDVHVTVWEDNDRWGRA